MPERRTPFYDFHLRAAGQLIKGGVVDDITVYKFHDEHFMIVTSSGHGFKFVSVVGEILADLA